MTVIQRAKAYLILKLSCKSRPGIVRIVAEFLAAHRCDILHMDQFDDWNSGRFYMRMMVRADRAVCGDKQALAQRFGEWDTNLGLHWEVHDLAGWPRMILMASRPEHCLADLLQRHRTGELAASIPAVVSNHRNHEELVRSFGIPFVHLPVSDANRTQQEEQVLALMEETGTQLLVLARYMQVLQPWLCDRLYGRIINIHHSFLPSFAGANPYKQAYARGVKVIGATAHYVTPRVDEGPIIEQVVERVDHTYQLQDLEALGRDLERLALARAVKYHLEHRVFLNGERTVVFR